MFHHYENPSNLNLHLNYLRWLKPIKIYTSYSLHFLQSIMILISFVLLSQGGNWNNCNRNLNIFKFLMI